MKKIILLLVLFYLSSCAHKNTKQDIKMNEHHLKQDVFPFKGAYSWSFKLMGSTQISTNTFYSDSIVYDMKGKVYSTSYPINKLSFAKTNSKFIGESPDHTVYVQFFKKKTDSTISIYKHKCKKNGLEEAIAFKLPNDDATDDHGWNTYTLKGYNNTEDLLHLSGTFKSLKHTISINDKVVVFDNKQVKKMSYHLGERRWVGKYKNRYLLLFFKEVEKKDTIQIFINWFDDIEKLYKTKYNSINLENWKDYATY